MKKQECKHLFEIKGAMNLWDHYRSQGSIKLFKKHEISLIGNPVDFLVYFSRV